MLDRKIRLFLFCLSQRTLEATMEELVQMKCTPRRKGEPTVTEKEIVEYLPQIPEWK
jgi:hypothetical protein